MSGKIVKIHKMAQYLPRMRPDEYQALCEDIKKNGVRHPVIVRQCDGGYELIDGINRVSACNDLGIDCPMEVVDMTDSDVLEYIISSNISRRHLSSSQKAMVAAKLVLNNVLTTTIKEVCERFGVSDRIGRNALIIASKCIDEVVKLVESGEVSVHDAVVLTGMPETIQRKAVTKYVSDATRASTLSSIATKIYEANMRGKESEDGNGKSVVVGGHKVVIGDEDLDDDESSDTAGDDIQDDEEEGDEDSQESNVKDKESQESLDEYEEGVSGSVFDDHGNVVPSNLEVVFLGNKMFLREAVRWANHCHRVMTSQDWKIPIPQHIFHALSIISGGLEKVEPFIVCSDCNGSGKVKGNMYCKRCNEKGWLSKASYAAEVQGKNNQQ